MSSEGYYQAAICRRGHVITALFEPAVGRAEPIPERCATCGAKVLLKCPQCQHRLKGRSRSGYALIGRSSWEPDEFCERCAHPFPWAKRESIALQIENMLDDEPGLDEGNRGRSKRACGRCESRLVIARLRSARSTP
jgi:hypothetical protein